MTTAQALADARFMRLALQEALKGLGNTHPNPAVGAAVVRGGKVISVGHHARAGLPHAEAVALSLAGFRARGATLYSTLEPCNHHGRTPPCTDAILAAGIRRVVFASSDPNPLVNGSGVKKLKARGVAVTAHVLRGQADALNRPFFTWMTQGRAHVTLKVAATLDGKLATHSGDSQWVSGPLARQVVHQLRDGVDAVLVGAGTVRHDDPRLTTRLQAGQGKNPLRLVLEGKRSLALTSRVFDAPGTVLVTTRALKPARLAALRARGAEVWKLPGRGGRASVRALLEACGRRGLLHVMVEGGAEVFAQFLTGAHWDELWLFLAPKLLGAEGLTWTGKLGISRMANALPGTLRSVEPVGDDLLLRLTREA